MIIDCHGHYTTAPRAYTNWREAQKAADAAGLTPPPPPDISSRDARRVSGELGDQPSRPLILLPYPFQVALPWS